MGSRGRGRKPVPPARVANQLEEWRASKKRKNILNVTQLARVANQLEECRANKNNKGNPNAMGCKPVRGVGGVEALQPCSPAAVEPCSRRALQSSSPAALQSCTASKPKNPKNHKNPEKLNKLKPPKTSTTS